MTEGRSSQDKLTHLRERLEALGQQPAAVIFILLCGPVAALATFSDTLSGTLQSLGNLADTLQLGVAQHYVKAGGGEFRRLSKGYWIETTCSAATPQDRIPSTPGSNSGTCREGELTIHFVLQVFRKDRQYIYLYDHSRAKGNDPTDPLLVRIPVRGGTAQSSYANP